MRGVTSHSAEISCFSAVIGTLRTSPRPGTSPQREPVKTVTLICQFEMYDRLHVCISFLPVLVCFHINRVGTLSDSRSLSLLLSHCHSLSRSRSRSLSLALSHSLSHSLSLTLSIHRSMYLSIWHALSCTLSLSLCGSLALSLIFPGNLPLTSFPLPARSHAFPQVACLKHLHKSSGDSYISHSSHALCHHHRERNGSGGQRGQRSTVLELIINQSKCQFTHRIIKGSIMVYVRLCLLLSSTSAVQL